MWIFFPINKSEQKDKYKYNGRSSSFGNVSMRAGISPKLSNNIFFVSNSIFLRETPKFVRNLNFGISTVLTLLMISISWKILDFSIIFLFLRLIKFILTLFMILSSTFFKRVFTKSEYFALVVNKFSLCFGKFLISFKRTSSNSFWVSSFWIVAIKYGKYLKLYQGIMLKEIIKNIVKISGNVFFSENFHELFKKLFCRDFFSGIFLPPSPELVEIGLV